MINKIVSKLKEAKTIAIYTHINVDCDAIGSSLALAESLQILGKQVDIFVHSNFPASFEFYGDLSFINERTVEGKYDLAVCLDCANEARLGKYRYTYKKTANDSICIDHHLTNENYCRTNYVTESSSTAEILYDFIKELNVPFNEKISKYLLSGIITDTGRFAHSITPRTFIIVSKLIKFGRLKIEKLMEQLINCLSMNLFNLMQRAYQKIEFLCDRKFAIIMFSQQDFKETGTSLDDTDVFPDIPLQIKDVQFAILASEDDKGYFRVSFRSKGEISARAVAESFGGGGHLNASGCKIFGEYEEVKQKLVDHTLSVLGWKI